MVSGVGAALVSSPLGIFTALVLAGVSQGFIFAPSAPYSMTHAGAAGPQRVFAASFAVISIGSVLGSAIGGVLPRLVGDDPTGILGYRVALVLGSLLAGIGTAAMLAARDQPAAPPADAPRPAPPERPARVADPAATRRAWRREIAGMGLSTAFLAASTGLFQSFFNVYLHDRAGASTEAIGVVFAVGAAAMVPASLLGTGIGERFGVVRTIVAARLLAVPLLILPLAAGGYGAGFLAYVLRAAVVTLTQPMDNAYVLSRAPDRQRARVAGLRTAYWNAGWAIATVAGGWAIVQWGYAPIFVAAGLTLAANALLYAAIYGLPPPGGPASAATASTSRSAETGLLR